MSGVVFRIFGAAKFPAVHAVSMLMTVLTGALRRRSTITGRTFLLHVGLAVVPGPPKPHEGVKYRFARSLGAVPVHRSFPKHLYSDPDLRRDLAVVLPHRGEDIRRGDLEIPWPARPMASAQRIALRR